MNGTRSWRGRHTAQWVSGLILAVAGLVGSGRPVQAQISHTTLRPTSVTRTIPAGSHNLDAPARTGTTNASPFIDDVFLNSVTFPVGMSAELYTAAASQAVFAVASRITYGQERINAEYGRALSAHDSNADPTTPLFDDNADGNDNPFAKAGIVPANTEPTVAQRENGTPVQNNNAIRAAFSSFSLMEGNDGEDQINGGETRSFSYILMFSKGVQDTNNAADQLAELLFLERGINSHFQVRAIIGGSSIDNPIYAPVTVEINNQATQELPTGIYIDTSEIGPTGQQLGAVGIDLSSFWEGTGLPVQPVYGVELIAYDGTGPDMYGIFGLQWDISFYTPVPPQLFLSASAVHLAKLEAVRNYLGTLIRWSTGFEADNLGFNVYREDGGVLTRVNSSLIAGSALRTGPRTGTTLGHSYSWQDPDPGGSAYWLEDIDLNGARTRYGPIYPTTSQPDGRGLKVENSPLLAAMNAQAAESQAFRRSATINVTPRQLALQRTLAGGAAVKIGVRQEGWYRLTQPSLLAAGLAPGTDPRTLHLYAEGQEIPIVLQGDGDGRLDPADSVQFYGLGLDESATDARVYWLTVGNRNPLRVASRAARSRVFSTATTSFPETVELRPRSLYFAALKNGAADNFFGPLVTTEPVQQTLKVSGLASGAAVLEVALQGVTTNPNQNQDHRVTVSLNGTTLGDVSFDGQQLGTAAFPLPAGLVVSGDNTVRLAAAGGTPEVADVSLLSTLRLTYPRTYRAEGNALRALAPAGQTVTLSGFSSGQIRVLDVTEPDNPSLVPVEISGGGTEWSAQLAVPGNGTRVLQAFLDGQSLTPAAVERNVPSTLNRATNRADLVILTHPDFKASVQPLVNLRRGQGLQVQVVDITDVYDEFSFGEKTPAAVSAFLKWTRTNWSRKPRFGLLLGDASFDPRNFLGLGSYDFVPTATVTTASLETASDDALADFNGDGIPELALGRLPVRTAAAATNAVNKIIAFDTSRSAAWRQQVLLVADANDDHTDFETPLTKLKSLAPGDLGVREVYRGQIGTAAARAQLFSALNTGQAVVNYLGHGTEDGWAGGLLGTADAGALASAKPAVFANMTCLNGLFYDLYATPLCKTLLNVANGGAVAVWASSGLTNAVDQVAPNAEFHRQLFTGATLGEAAVAAKRMSTSEDVRRTWILFGDPTMRVR